MGFGPYRLGVECMTRVLPILVLMHRRGNKVEIFVEVDGGADGLGI